MKLLLDALWACSVGGEAALKSCCCSAVQFATVSDLQQRQLTRDLADAAVARLLLQEASVNIFWELLLLGTSGGLLLQVRARRCLPLSALTGSFCWLPFGYGLPMHFVFS